MDWSSIWSSFLMLNQFALRHFTDGAIKALAVARNHAAVRKHCRITPEHVLFALATVERGPFQVTLEGMGLDLSQHREEIEGLVDAIAVVNSEERLDFSPEAREMLSQARAQALELGHNYVGREHLVLGLLMSGSWPASKFLRERGITPDSLREALKLSGA